VCIFERSVLTLAKKEGKADDISIAVMPKKPFRSVEQKANRLAYWDGKKQSDSSAD
jgi:hypothetical protein